MKMLQSTETISVTFASGVVLELVESAVKNAINSLDFPRQIYIAVDDDGRVYAYPSKPDYFSGYWDQEQDQCYIGKAEMSEEESHNCHLHIACLQTSDV